MGNLSFLWNFGLTGMQRQGMSKRTKSIVTRPINTHVLNQGRRQRGGGQWCPPPHLKSVPPISQLAFWLLHTSNTIF